MQLPLFGLLALGDVDRGADHAHASIAAVEKSAALGSNPSNRSVLFADGAIFDVIACPLRGVASGRKSGRGRLLVVGMQPSVKIVQAD